METLCDSWRQRQSVAGEYRDHFDGHIWEDLQFDPDDGSELLASAGAIGIQLFFDSFRAFRKAQHKVGGLYAAVQNLPRDIRFRPENMMLISLIPGPSEPPLTINSFIKPLVDELLEFHAGVTLATANSGPAGRRIKCVLTSVTGDLPAVRKFCGFFGVRAKRACTKCNKSFRNAGREYVCGDMKNAATWALRTSARHDIQVDAIPEEDKEGKGDPESGVRYSQLLRIPYFSIISQHSIDAMHCLYLGMCCAALYLL